MTTSVPSSELPKVEYKRLGKSGLRVSVPIVGAGSFGSDKWAKWVLNEDQALPLLKYAWDRGINTWDTANIYSDGWSEKVIAAAIKKYNIPREKLVILTKCYGLVRDEPNGIFGDPSLKNTRDYVNQSGLSRQAIFNAVDASLKRLETPYIDLLQIHRLDKETPMEEIMEALHDLVKSGKVRYIGASSMWTWEFVLLNEIAEKKGWTKFVSMQNQYSLLYREEEREMNAYCNHAGIGLIPWSPLAGGYLARPADQNTTTRVESSTGTPFERKLSDADLQIIQRVEELAKKKGWKMAQVALAWIATKVSSPIVGFNSRDRLEEAIISGKSLSADEIKYLEEPYTPKPISGHS